MTFYKFRQYHIPDYMASGIRRYIDEGIAPGQFLTAVITNNLRNAVWYADDENQANLPAYIAYFYNEAPASCWGSPEKMGAWLTERKAHPIKKVVALEVVK